MISHSSAETRLWGARLAEQLQPGDVLLLEGNLGAGKSELTRGIAEGLGIHGPVPSPSFTILNVYDSGRIPLYHFDWYRPEAIPERYLRVTITPTAENEREITWEPVGGFRNLREMDA